MKKKLKNSNLSDKELKEVWKEALNIWSPYVRLQNPIFCINRIEEQKEALSGSFAMIRLRDLRVVISLRQIKTYGLEEYLKEILAHEIGHHVFCPADLNDLARLLVRIRHGLPTLENEASFIGNLYSDLLINNHLFRQNNLPMQKIYLKVNIPNKNLLWNFYMRIYEILWSLPRHTLTHIDINEEMEADALLANRLIRNYKKDWIRGAGPFAAICLTYLLKDPDKQNQSFFRIWMDTRDAAVGDEMPVGITSMEEDEFSGNLHPAVKDSKKKPSESLHQKGGSSTNFREPFEYLEIIKSMGINLSEQEIIIQYYKERAIPYLIPFPQKKNTELHRTITGRTRNMGYRRSVGIN